MNEPFGDAWGRQILIAACAATGQRPPEPQTKSVEAATSEPGKPWLTEAPRYSQGFEELLIREYFADQKGGYFVDVGAGPALAGSNTAFLERHLGWQGIGVDALGHYEDNYLEQRPRTRFINFVVAESSSPAHPFFHVVAAEGLSSTDEARMFEGKPLNSKRVEVPAATLDEILDAAQLTHIDFMSIDVEASNLSCLKGLNLRKHRPRLVCMETGDPTSQQRRDIIEHFQAAGFVLVPEFRPYTAPNTWFHPRPAPLIPNSSKPGSANTSGA
ncbi:MAG: FkbM family methyltransferase [Pseudomonadota bacterium]